MLGFLRTNLFPPDFSGVFIPYYQGNPLKNIHMAPLRRSVTGSSFFLEG